MVMGSSLQLDRLGEVGGSLLPFDLPKLARTHHIQCFRWPTLFSKTENVPKRVVSGDKERIIRYRDDFRLLNFKARFIDTVTDGVAFTHGFCDEHKMRLPLRSFVAVPHVHFRSSGRSPGSLTPSR